jgi:hypothetical protein
MHLRAKKPYPILCDEPDELHKQRDRFLKISVEFTVSAPAATIYPVFGVSLFGICLSCSGPTFFSGITLQNSASR